MVNGVLFNKFANSFPPKIFPMHGIMTKGKGIHSCQVPLMSDYLCALSSYIIVSFLYFLVENYYSNSQAVHYLIHE